MSSVTDLIYAHNAKYPTAKGGKNSFDSAIEIMRERRMAREKGGGVPIPRFEARQIMPERSPAGKVIPKGWDELGRPTGYIRDPMIEKQKEQEIKTQSEKEAGQRMADQSFGMVSGALQELAQTYADAVAEGGVGGRLAKTKSDAALWLGGSPAENFPATSAFPGQKTEVIARMMPLLTQQGDKPGSVRLVQTVFDKLEKTLPDGNTPPKNARRMMEQTIRNMFRFARASQIMTSQMGVTDEYFDGLPEKDQKRLSDRLTKLAETVDLSPEEEMQIEQIIGTALRPIDSMKLESKSNSSASGFVEGKIYRDAQGNRAKYQGGAWVPVQ